MVDRASTVGGFVGDAETTVTADNCAVEYLTYLGIVVKILSKESVFVSFYPTHIGIV